MNPMIVVKVETPNPPFGENGDNKTTPPPAKYKIENFCGENMFQQFKEKKFCDVTLAAGEKGKR